jgi:hypothetical protein
MPSKTSHIRVSLSPNVLFIYQIVKPICSLWELRECQS